jgi:hypothetical protein
MLWKAAQRSKHKNPPLPGAGPNSGSQMMIVGGLRFRDFSVRAIKREGQTILHTIRRGKHRRGRALLDHHPAFAEDVEYHPKKPIAIGALLAGIRSFREVFGYDISLDGLESFKPHPSRQWAWDHAIKGRRRPRRRRPQ